MGNPLLLFSQKTAKLLMDNHIRFFRNDPVRIVPWQRRMRTIARPWFPSASSKTHCLNPEVRIRKKMQEKYEAAMRTPSQRVSK